MKEFISRLTWVDYLTVIVALRGVYVGFKSGFFPELLRIVIYLVTVIAAFHFYEPFAEQITLKTFLNLQVSTVIAFAVIFLVVFLILRLAMLFFLKLLKVGEGGAVNRFLGGILGVGRWMLLLSILFMLIDDFPAPSLKSDIKEHSIAGPYVSKVAPALFDFLSTLSPQLSVKNKRL